LAKDAAARLFAVFLRTHAVFLQTQGISVRQGHIVCGQTKCKLSTSCTNELHAMMANIRHVALGIKRSNGTTIRLQIIAVLILEKIY
jgi:hypothetical protein